MGGSAAYWAAAVVAAAGTANSMEESRKSRHAREDLLRDAKKVEENAALSANSRLAMRRRALAKNSLASGESAGQGLAMTGRTTLGGQ